MPVHWFEWMHVHGAHHKTGARPLPGDPLNSGVAARDELIEIAAQ
jgi:hypothetical protein